MIKRLHGTSATEPRKYCSHVAVNPLRGQRILTKLFSQSEVPVKKFLALLTGTLAVCGLSANPMGNAADPVTYEDGISVVGKSDTAFRVGYIGDYVVDRNLHIKHTPHSKSELAMKDFQGAEFTVNMYDRFDVLGRVGYSQYNTRWRTGTAGDTARVSTRSDFAWALGAKAVLYQWDNTTFSVGGSYVQGNAKVDRAEITGGTGTPSLMHVSDSNVKQRERKWNVGATMGYQCESFAPYIGIQYIKDKVTFNKSSIADPSITLPTKLENRRKLSAALGVGILAAKKASLNIEGRFIGESAVTLTGQARF